MIVFLLLILVFIIIEKWGTFREGFLNSEYDYYHNGDLYIDTRNKGNVNIGIGNDVDNKYAINVGGTLFVKDKLCYGNTCLTEYLLSLLNKIPVFFSDKLCVQDSNGKKTCVSENRLKILTGEKTTKFRSVKTPENNYWKNKASFLHSVNTWSPGAHDDDNDISGQACYDHGAWCSWWDRRQRGMMYGVGVDTILNDGDKRHGHLIKKFNGFLSNCGNSRYRWSDPQLHDNDFYIIPNNKNPINYSRYSKVKNNFTPKQFSYKCYPT